MSIIIQSEPEPPVFDAEMLLGELRDVMLAEIKRHVDWPKIEERQQKATNNEIEHAARQAIKATIAAIHAVGFDAIPVVVSGLKQGKEGAVEAKLSAEGTEANVLGLFRAGRCSLVLTDPDKFMGARPAPVMKDQPDLLDDAPSALAAAEAPEAVVVDEDGVIQEAPTQPEMPAEEPEEAEPPRQAPRGHRGRRRAAPTPPPGE